MFSNICLEQKLFQNLMIEQNAQSSHTTFSHGGLAKKKGWDITY